MNNFFQQNVESMKSKLFQKLFQEKLAPIIENVNKV